MTETPTPGQMESHAEAVVFRDGPLFSRHRYTVALEVDGIETGVHAHTRTKRAALRLAKELLENAEDILIETGLMGILYNAAKAKAKYASLPLPGTTVYLMDQIGYYPEGTPMVVESADWDTNVHDENNVYPVMAFPEGEPDVKIPLHPADFTSNPQDVL